jgi:hypothetical protein
VDADYIRHKQEHSSILSVAPGQQCQRLMSDRKLLMTGICANIGNWDRKNEEPTTQGEKALPQKSI